MKRRPIVQLAAMLLTLSAGAGPVSAGGPIVVFEMSGMGVEVGETVVSRSGRHVAFVLSLNGKSEIFVDGRRAREEEAVDQLHVLESGEILYWFRRNGKEWLRLPGGSTAGPYESITVPDLDVLGSMSEVQSRDWSFRAGTKVVFAARDRTGEWVMLVRYPAAPDLQDTKPLPVTRVVWPGADPTLENTAPLRYRLIRDKVPIFIGVKEKGENECLVVGAQEVGCGFQVAMLAWSPVSGRTAHALRVKEGLVVNSGHALYGPTSRVDWISFSPDGSRLAMVVAEEGRDVLIIDDERVASSERIEPVAWTSLGLPVYVSHSETGSRLFVDGVQVMEKTRIDAVYLSPSGEVLALGRDATGLTLHPWGVLEGVDSLWSEGFLPNGTFYAIGHRSSGEQTLLMGGKARGSWTVVSWLTPSPDGEKLAAVGSTAEGDVVIVDGDVWKLPRGQVRRLDWCGARWPLVITKGGERGCVVSKKGEYCCGGRKMREPPLLKTGVELKHGATPGGRELENTVRHSVEVLGAVCLPGGEVMQLCEVSDRYAVMRDGKVVGKGFDYIPPQFVFQDITRGQLDFAARRGEEWYIVIGGREHAAGGTVEFVYPGADGAWFRVKGHKGVRWWSPSGPSPFFAGTAPPWFVSGRSMFRARKGGQETWVLQGKELGWTDRLESRPIVRSGRLLYWTRDENILRLMELPE